MTTDTDCHRETYDDIMRLAEEEADRGLSALRKGKDELARMALKSSLRKYSMAEDVAEILLEDGSLVMEARNKAGETARRFAACEPEDQT